MGAWRSKFIFLLIVYFAGFATAIYILVPVPENQACNTGEKNSAYPVLKTDKLAQSFSAGMHKCVDFAKDAAWRTGKRLKQKYDERQSQTNG